MARLARRPRRPGADLASPAEMDTGHITAQWSSRKARARTACGVIAAPLFVSAFEAIGARRAGYDRRRHAVSSLAAGRGGWAQRANFILAGTLYCVGAQALAQDSAEAVGPAAVPAVVFAAGVGLIGAGVFVTDPVNGFPPGDQGPDGPTPTQIASRAGQLHNLCAIPVFVGIPIAALICAGSAASRSDYRWAAWCAGSAIGMTGATALFGAGFGGAARFAEHAGVWQRVSIATGFGWLSALSLRALRASRSA